MYKFFLADCADYADLLQFFLLNLLNQREINFLEKKCFEFSL